MSEYAGDWPTHERFEEGLKVRRTVVGEARVRTALESADNLSKPLQELVTSYAWGEIWTRPGLSLKSRSILTVGMLIALGKPNELKVHMLGAINNGVSYEELSEIVIHASVYAGFPAALEAMAVARSLVSEHGGDLS
jgi:4-carboxymuconolactone decarboxylase